MKFGVLGRWPWAAELGIRITQLAVNRVTLIGEKVQALRQMPEELRVRFPNAARFHTLDTTIVTYSSMVSNGTSIAYTDSYEAFAGGCATS